MLFHFLGGWKAVILGLIVPRLFDCFRLVVQLGKAIHGFVYRNGFDLRSYILTALIEMYGKMLLLDRGKKGF